MDTSGTVRVFARASGRSLETTSLPSGGSWSGFTSLGGTWPGWTNLDGTVTGTPAVVQDQSSTIRVYARGTGGNLEEFYSAWHSDSRGGSLY